MTNWWINKTWAGLHAPHRQEALQLGAAPFVPCKEVSWVEYVVPADMQNGYSCAAYAMVNFKETMLRYHLGRSVFSTWQQLNGYAVFLKARDMFYSGNTDGGLFMHEAFAAALAMGIFAPGSVLKTVRRAAAMHSDQFERTPFIDGRDVSGWITRNVSPDNGQVYEGASSAACSGHATLDVARVFQGAQNFWIDLNSWGTKFGWNGLFMLSENYDMRTGIEPVKYYVEEPPGWEAWDGWKQWVIT